MSTIATSTQANPSVTNSATTLAQVCHILGYLSIFASIAIWMLAQGDGGVQDVAHAERFGVFVGLWAPTFFALSIKYEPKKG